MWKEVNRKKMIYTNLVPIQFLKCWCNKKKAQKLEFQSGYSLLIPRNSMLSRYDLKSGSVFRITKLKHGFKMECITAHKLVFSYDPSESNVI